MEIINGFNLKNLRGDILGGITAAVVALPLALAFGNAALGPGGAIYGLYGAVVVGFLAALFGGTPAQVSGPTGPMSVTVAGVVAGLAAVGVPRDLSAGQILPLVMAAVVIGGLLQILFGILKLGKYITLVPFCSLRIYVWHRSDNHCSSDWSSIRNKYPRRRNRVFINCFF